MNVLVTGGAGFVGRHLTNALLRQGKRVTIVDNLSSGLHHSYWADLGPPYLTTHYHDVRDFFKRAQTTQFDEVYHCAAVVGGRLKIEGDPLAVAVDLSIDSELFNWCVKFKHGTKRVVYFSSSAVYPIELQTSKHHCALNELMVCPGAQSRIGLPDLTYGWSKLSGEYLAQIAAQQHGLNVHIFRPFSGYGEDQSFDYPFPSIIKRAVDGSDPFLIWGSGRQQRDFIHIDDVVQAVLSTENKMPPGTVLNLGTGVATSFHDLAVLAWRKCAHSRLMPLIHADEEKPEGVFSRVADTYKLKTMFCEPTITLDEGVGRMIEYLRAREK